MILRKKIASLLLVSVLCLGMAANADASEISETEKKAEELENQKKAAEGEKASLENQLNGILTEMDETKAKIEAKEIEVREKEEELVQAKIDENDQYESMKKRIKYMYENGNSQFIEILCESKSIGEFLNNAEYITTISQYDRNMLTEFQQIVEAVAEQEEMLKTEYAELETLQDSLIAKQEELNQLVEGKEEELKQISADLGATQERLAQLKEAAAAAARKQEELARLAKAQAEAQANAGSGGGAGAAVVSGNGMFTHPCPGYSRISSEFGWREAPIAGAGNNHKGMDLAAPTNLCGGSRNGHDGKIQQQCGKLGRDQSRERIADLLYACQCIVCVGGPVSEQGTEHCGSWFHGSVYGTASAFSGYAEWDSGESA